MQKTNNPIGIFDSGVGGLTVAKKVIEYLPNEEILYFGDNARAPYGIHTNERITQQSKQILRFLEEKDVKCAIIACNTICAAGYDELAAVFGAPLYSIITPAAKACAELMDQNASLKKIGIIATNATVNSGIYEREIKKLRPDAIVLQQACPELTVLAEAGLADREEGRRQIEEYLQGFKKEGIDILVFGCTHYPLFRRHVPGILGESVVLVDPADAAVLMVKETLGYGADEAELAAKPKHKFYTSGDVDKFEEIARIVLDSGAKEALNVCQIDIEEY